MINKIDQHEYVVRSSFARIGNASATGTLAFTCSCARI